MSKTERPEGRPTKLTPEVQKILLGKLRKGMPIAYAAEAAGLSRHTVKEWVARGEGRDADREPDPLYEGFATACRQARAQGVEILVDVLFEAAIGRRPSRRDPKKLVRSRISSLRVSTAQWLLSRCHPEEFGSSRESMAVRIAQEAVEGSAGSKRPVIEIKLAHLPEDEPVEPA